MNKRLHVRERVAAGAARSITEPDQNSGHEASLEAIARLAYSYWEARGYQGGSAEEDWLRAERELRDRMLNDGVVAIQAQVRTLKQAG